MINRPTISYIIIMGDSLSDRGTLAKRKLLGLIPMKLFSGLSGVSPDDRFTNGLPWSDGYIATLASEFTIRRLTHEYRMDSTDIMDGIIDNDPHVEPFLREYYTLKNSKIVDYHGHPFARSYAEGGLSSHDYRFTPTTSLTFFVTRLVLSTLGEMRQQLLHDDRTYQVSPQVKQETLVIEWSGANDMFKVNARPTQAIVNHGVHDRIDNLKKLIRAGYRHFILFNLPDISLSPKFQALSAQEQQNAKRCVENFNQQLAYECHQIRQDNTAITLQLFDVHREFMTMYQHPERFRLDPAKRTQPYTTSPDFHMLDNGTSPSTGYMFWDDVHPTADVHAYLTDKFCETYKEAFQYKTPDCCCVSPPVQTRRRSS